MREKDTGTFQYDWFLNADGEDMMRTSLFVAVSVLVSGCSAPDPVEAPPHPLVGTWRLVEWREKDSLGVWQEEFGAEPRGYFVYGPSGFLSIQIMHEDGAEVTGCDADDLPEDLAGEGFLVAPRCYVGYFGSYRIENDSTVVHLPTGGTILGYIGSEQPRRFEVRGDSLWIQRSDSVYRLLLRVSPGAELSDGGFSPISTSRMTTGRKIGPTSARS